MDALEFLRGVKRIYNLSTTSNEDCEIIIATVEQWLKEHPRKTRQSVFLEQWPEADVDDTDGCLTLNPCEFYRNMRKECSGKLCADFRREFWMQEVE